MISQKIIWIALCSSISLELTWDYFERKKTGKVNHLRGFIIRSLIAIAIYWHAKWYVLIYIGGYIAFFNPLINTVWFLGGWKRKGEKWIDCIKYIGRTSWIDQIWRKLFGKKTESIVLPLTFIIGIGMILLSKLLIQ